MIFELILFTFQHPYLIFLYLSIYIYIYISSVIPFIHHIYHSSIFYFYLSMCKMEIRCLNKSFFFLFFKHPKILCGYAYHIWLILISKQEGRMILSSWLLVKKSNINSRKVWLNIELIKLKQSYFTSWFCEIELIS